MRLNFLCVVLRESLVKNPAKGRAVWDVFLERLLDTEYAVTPYRVRLAGSAMEAAEIYLMAHPQCSVCLINRYAKCAVNLLEMLTDLGQSRLMIVVAARSTALLEHLGHESGHYDVALARTRHIMDSVSHLGGVGHATHGEHQFVVAGQARSPRPFVLEG